MGRRKSTNRRQVVNQSRRREKKGRGNRRTTIRREVDRGVITLRGDIIDVK